MEEVKYTFVPFQVSSSSPPPILRYSLFLNSFASTAISDQAVNLSHPILLFGYPSYKIWFILHLPYVASSSLNFLFPIYFFFNKNSFQRKFFVAILLLPVLLFAANGKQRKPWSTDNHQSFFKTDLTKKQQ